MDITSAPRVTKTYAGIKFEVPMCYSAGHTLTQTEADGLNSLIAQRLGNSQAGSIRRAIQALHDANLKAIKEKSPTARFDEDEKGKKVPHAYTVADLGARDWQEEFDDLAAEFELGVSGRGGSGTAGGTDPVERLATTLASEAVKAKLIERGYKVRTFMLTPANSGEGSRLSELTRDWLKSHPELREAAKAQLAASAKTDETAFDDLLGPQAQAA